MVFLPVAKGWGTKTFYGIRYFLSSPRLGSTYRLVGRFKQLRKRTEESGGMSDVVHRSPTNTTVSTFSLPTSA